MQPLSAEALRGQFASKSEWVPLPGRLIRTSSRAAMRVFLGRMKEGEGKCSSSRGSTGLLGAVDGAVDVSFETTETFRLEVKNLSSRSNPLVMMPNVSPEWRTLNAVV
jgi:hypothetical protein